MKDSIPKGRHKPQSKGEAAITMNEGGCERLPTLLSSLIFIGLQYTRVTNAVLLGWLGPVLFALVRAVLLGKRIRRPEWFGFSLIVVGVVAIALKTSNFQINQEDLYILEKILR